MKIGGYKIYSIRTGLLKLDGGAMFGTVPKQLWNQTNPADEFNRIEMATNSLLLVSEKRKIIIDTGTGNKLSKKLKEIYAVDQEKYSIQKSLENLNISCTDITDVILTHLHFDHCGGTTYIDNNKEMKATFPNAKHYVQEKHLDWAFNPTERDKASFFERDFTLLLEKKLLIALKGEHKFDEHISFHIVNGHTPFMQLVKISDDNRTMLYTADLVPMSRHVSLPYIMGYDLLPLVTLNEKKYYLKEAADNNWMLFLEHDPYVECATVEYKENQYSLKNKINI